MDLLTGKIRPIYFKYLSAAFGSAMITSVYSIVDMAMVGQYQGPDGTAALAVVAPIWNIIYSLGLLMGIGGPVIFSTLRGQTERKGKVENEYFTTAVIGAAVFSGVAWLAILFFEKPLTITNSETKIRFARFNINSSFKERLPFSFLIDNPLRT